MAETDKDTGTSGNLVADAFAAVVAAIPGAQGVIDGLQDILNPAPVPKATSPEDIETYVKTLLNAPGNHPEIPSAVLGEWIRTGTLDQALQGCPEDTITGISTTTTLGEHVALQLEKKNNHWGLYTAPTDGSKGTEVQFFETSVEGVDQKYDYSKHSELKLGQLTLGSEPINLEPNYTKGLSTLMANDQDFTVNLFQNGLVLGSPQNTIGREQLDLNVLSLDPTGKLQIGGWSEFDDLFNNPENNLINHIQDMLGAVENASPTSGEHKGAPIPGSDEWRNMPDSPTLPYHPVECTPDMADKICPNTTPSGKPIEQAPVPKGPSY